MGRLPGGAPLGGWGQRWIDHGVVQELTHVVERDMVLTGQVRQVPMFQLEASLTIGEGGPLAPNRSPGRLDLVLGPGQPPAVLEVFP